MGSGRTPWLRWAVVLCLLLLAVNARAAVRIGSAPPGWDADATGDARALATAWADDLDGRITEVFSTAGDDDFSETLAVISLAGAMQEDASVDPESALVDAVGALFEGEPESPRLVEGTEDAPIITGVWDQDGITHEVAVVSVGPSRAAIVLAVRSAERSLYSQVFDDVVAELTGAVPPVTAFNVQRWRVGTIVGWLAMLVVGWLITANTSLGSDGSATVGRAVAALCIFTALVAALIVYVLLDGAEAPLRLAGVSRFTMATEVAAGGLVAALIAWFLGTLRDGTVRRVESAPKGGTFSGSARTLTNNLVPPTKPAALTDPGHGMSEQELEEADRELMNKRQPLATLVGAPSLAASSGDDTFDKVWAEAQAAAEAQVDAEAAAESAGVVRDEIDASTTSTREMVRPNFDVPKEVLDPPRPKGKSRAGTIVGHAPAPETVAPKRKPKTKTEVLQFPPPMSDDDS